MRNIKHLVAHCTATPQTTTVDSIERYWSEVKGWENPGYHYIILPNGVIEQLLPEGGVSNGVQGYNKTSINVAYIGGVDKNGKAVDNRTEAQKRVMYNLFKHLKERYPTAIIQGHRDFPNVKKSCPSFDAKKWAEEMGLQ